MRSSLFALVALGLITSGCTIHSQALRPQPNIVSPGRTAGAVTLDVSGIPAGEVCHDSSGVREICVSGLREAFRSGMTDVLNQFYGRVAGAPDLIASVKLVEFTYGPAGVAGVSYAPGMTTPVIASLNLMMKWQFQLTDASGTPVIQLAETTAGPIPVARAGSTDEAVKSLVEAVLERAGKELAAHLQSAPRVPSTATAAVSAEANPGPQPLTTTNYLDRCPRIEGESAVERARRCRASQAVSTAPAP